MGLDGKSEGELICPSGHRLRELLHVLGRLIELEPAQADLLNRFVQRAALRCIRERCWRSRFDLLGRAPAVRN
jgi:hypothetical protein